MTSPLRFLSLAVLVAACHEHGGRPPDGSSAVATASPAPDAPTTETTAIPPEAPEPPAADAGASCAPTLLQKDACISKHADLALDARSLRGWIVDRGAVPPDAMPDACREVTIGGEPLLACIDRHGAAADPGLGAYGPILFFFDLEVLAIRKKHLVKILKVPIAMGSSGASYDDPGEMYFSATFTVTADAVDVDAPRAECTQALAAMPAFFKERKAMLAEVPRLDPASLAQLVRATGKEEKLSGVHIGAICRAAGHYIPGAGDRLQRH